MLPELPAVLPLIGLDGIILKSGGHGAAVNLRSVPWSGHGEQMGRSGLSLFSRAFGRASHLRSLQSAGCSLGPSQLLVMVTSASAAKTEARIEWLGELTNGPVPNGLCVCHRCDNPPCINPAHLFLGTVKDNNQDRATKGRSADVRGHRSPLAKLTQQQAAEIRRRRLAGETIVALAREFNIHHGTVSRIAKGQTWNEL